MPRFLYTAWFRDDDALEDDQDREWPACFMIEAADEGRALAWGDHLAGGFAGRRPKHFLQSHVETPEADASSLPVVEDGEEAGDQTIGW